MCNSKEDNLFVVNVFSRLTQTPEKKGPSHARQAAANDNFFIGVELYQLHQFTIKLYIECNFNKDNSFLLFYFFSSSLTNPRKKRPVTRTSGNR